MKNRIVLSISSAVVLLVFILSSCQKTQSSNDINYKAAYVVNGGSNSISVIDLSSNEVKKTISLPNVMWPHHISINRLKTMIAIGVPGMDLSGGHSGINNAGMTGMVAVYDAVKGTELKMINLSMMNHNAAFSPDGSEIWSALMDTMGTVKVYDANTYTLKTTINVGMMPAEITFSADGTMAFVANGMSNDVTAINVTSKAVITTIPVGMEPVGAWTGSDNKMYVDNEMGQTISVIDVSSMTVTATINLGFMPGMAAYNGTMSELWVSDPDNGKVHWWTKSGNTYAHGGEVATGAGAHAIAFNQMTVYITNQLAGSVSVLDVNTHTKLKDISVGIKPNGITLKN
jgi:YVTN family beta-propeller protein